MRGQIGRSRPGQTGWCSCKVDPIQQMQRSNLRQRGGPLCRRKAQGRTTAGRHKYREINQERTERHQCLKEEQQSGRSSGGCPQRCKQRSTGRKRRCQLWGQSERDQGGAALCSSRHRHKASWLREGRLDSGCVASGRLLVLSVPRLSSVKG